MIKTAIISEDGVYRYALRRVWGDGPLLGWIMLNPSTADHAEDDPTIRRCMSFARAWRYDGIIVRNLFALRATNPKELLTHPDPFGPRNTAFLEASWQQDATVAAWGANKAAKTALSHNPTRNALSELDLLCLGKTKDGAPKHPLYVPGDTEPQTYATKGWAEELVP